MKRPIFRVHGPPEKRRYFYGSFLIMLGALIMFGAFLPLIGLFYIKIISLSLLCLGFWTCWHALRLGDAHELPRWMNPFLLFVSVVLTVILILLVIAGILVKVDIIDV